MWLLIKKNIEIENKFNIVVMILKSLMMQLKLLKFFNRKKWKIFSEVI